MIRRFLGALFTALHGIHSFHNFIDSPA